MCSHFSSQLKRAIYCSFFSPPQYHHHYHHLLRSPLSTQTHPKELPFIVNYLISSFGFSLDRALKASADSHLTAIKSPARPDAVVKFLTDTGLSHTQIKSVVSLQPALLGYDVDKTLRPKVRQMMEIMLNGSDLTFYILKMDIWDHDVLAKRCAKYYVAGVRFAKWRAVLKIGPNESSQLCIDLNAPRLLHHHLPREWSSPDCQARDPGRLVP